ncbi:MAG: hypothetical protein KY467_03655 [Gemmatimonadetes bacterium]|nr:hypothetical protein [Gemmatimonadota bacterium]
MQEPLTISADSLPFFREKVDRLLDACLAFKVREPFGVPPAALDEDALRAAAAIRAEGEPLDDVLEALAGTVLPASVNFGAPAFLAHPDCGNSIAAALGDFAR